MKLRYATMAIAGFVLSPTPAFAAPQSVEDACWRYAQRVTPHLSAREREAYVTNCIADWTAGTRPPQGRRNVRCTEKELNSIRGGLTAEEYRWKLSPLTMKRWTARPGGEGSLKQMDEWDS